MRTIVRVRPSQSESSEAARHREHGRQQLQNAALEKITRRSALIYVFENSFCGPTPDLYLASITSAIAHNTPHQKHITADPHEITDPKESAHHFLPREGPTYVRAGGHPACTPVAHRGTGFQSRWHKTLHRAACTRPRKAETNVQFRLDVLRAHHRLSGRPRQRDHHHYSIRQRLTATSGSEPAWRRLIF